MYMHEVAHIGFVCLHVCSYVCMMQVHTWGLCVACMFMSVCVCMKLHIQGLCVCRYVHMCVHANAHMRFVCLHVCLCVCMYIPSMSVLRV